jgi:protein-S-isoprenylcysteine O-methyltransferase Ste14
MGSQWNPGVVSSRAVTDSRIRAITGSVGFLLLGGPTIVAGLVPWLLTRWDADPQPLALRIVGILVLLAGALLVLETTARFALQGRGTPAPWAPPERFVERGSYRFVRSPMYLGVILLVVGQGLLLGREVLFVWAAAALLGFTAFLVFYEEPQLRRRFGDDYDDYRGRVRRWLPTRPRSFRY